MSIDKRSGLAIVFGLGVAIYYCEWLSIFGAEELCGPAVIHLIRIYVAPILVGAVLGVWLSADFSPVFWLALVGPSFLLRQIQFFLLPDGPGNLWPLSVAVDVFVCVITLLAMYVSARLARRHPRDKGSESNGPGWN